ncbi:hypothetical protein B0H11DRAFT_584846 [Mycena galericulata]|nr:hypothetical protein B0H11DRAFT_584846 [Mycena galericulata]
MVPFSNFDLYVVFEQSVPLFPLSVHDLLTAWVKRHVRRGERVFCVLAAGSDPCSLAQITVASRNMFWAYFGVFPHTKTPTPNAPMQMSGVNFAACGPEASNTRSYVSEPTALQEVVEWRLFEDGVDCRPQTPAKDGLPRPTRPLGTPPRPPGTAALHEINSTSSDDVDRIPPLVPDARDYTKEKIGGIRPTPSYFSICVLTFFL